MTAVALVPLTLWFAASLIMLADRDYASLIAWIKSPFVALSMVLLLIVQFSHLALGLQVVIEGTTSIRGRRVQRSWRCASAALCSPPPAF